MAKASIVISRLNYFFSNHGFGERDMLLHVDNCTGQNKNNCMMQYLVGLSDSIDFSIIVIVKLLSR